MGRDTGLKSYRTTIFRRFPRTGIPDHFGSWGEYENYVKLLVELHCIDDARRSGGTCGRIRPSARWSSASATCRRAWTRRSHARRAVQAIVVKLHRLYQRATWASALPPGADRGEQVARGALGLDGKLIDFGKRVEVPMRDLALELLEFVDDVVDDWAAGGGRLRPHDPARGDERRSAARGLPAETGDLRRVVRLRRGRRRRRGTKQARSQRELRDEESACCAGGSTLPAGVHRPRQRARAPHGITGRDGEAGRHEDGRAAARYRVIVDRISHEVEYYRGA